MTVFRTFALSPALILVGVVVGAQTPAAHLRRRRKERPRLYDGRQYVAAVSGSPSSFWGDQNPGSPTIFVFARPR